MPLVRISVRSGLPSTIKKAMLDAVHAALVEAFHIPDDDRTQQLSEHRPEDFEAPPGRSDRYALIEITAFPGRSSEAKRVLYGAIVRNLTAAGWDARDILIVIVESPLENWGVRGGVPASEVDLGYPLDV